MEHQNNDQDAVWRLVEEIAMDKKMTTIQEKTLTQAMRMLNAIGATYVIKDSDGLMHGELKIDKPKRVFDHPHGDIRKFVRPYIDELQIGEVASIPCETYGRQKILMAVSALMIRKSGTGAYKTNYVLDDNILEVIRYS
jgi:hypothetical protein